MVSIDAPQDSSRLRIWSITGHQWWWDARYPNGVVALATSTFRLARRLLVRIESTDVIHDFWAPELARKMDAVPGRPSYIWLEADQPGMYTGTCSEFCGAQHAWMRFRVIAEPEASFDAWLKRQAQLPPVAERPGCEGERLFRARNAPTVTRRGARYRKGPEPGAPGQPRVPGRRHRRNTPENLALWLTDPQAAKPGNRMPDTPLSRRARRDAGCWRSGEPAMKRLALRDRSQARRHPLYAFGAVVLPGRRHGSDGDAGATGRAEPEADHARNSTTRCSPCTAPR